MIWPYIIFIEAISNSLLLQAMVQVFLSIELKLICISIIKFPIQSSIFAFRAQQYVVWMNQSKIIESTKLATIPYLKLHTCTKLLYNTKYCNISIVYFVLRYVVVNFNFSITISSNTQVLCYKIIPNNYILNNANHQRGCMILFW